MTEGASGVTCMLRLKMSNHQAGMHALIPTGIAAAIPVGYEAQIRPRSGLALKHGITLLNSPGTIDSDYRGEIQVIVINLGSEEYILKRGERIAQMVFTQVAQAELVEVDELDETDRGPEVLAIRENEGE
jgi:dUTP pyrophosphatase